MRLHLLSVVLFCLMMLLLVVACDEQVPTAPVMVDVVKVVPDVAAPEIPASEERVEIQKEKEELVKITNEIQQCTVNGDCSDGVCIDNRCGVIADLYETNCEKKCTLKEVTVVTSDGDTLMFPPGKGTYTSAGALVWNIAEAPLYCALEKLPVVFRITTMQYGKPLSDTYITLRRGETSDVLTHPIISRIAFTLAVKDIREVCG